MDSGYFPFTLIDKEEDDSNYSLILSQFNYFDAYAGGKDFGGGYTLERLARKLAAAHKIRGLKYDSEAGMFCVIAKDRAPLIQLCQLLLELIGDVAKYKINGEQAGKKFSEKAAAQLLLKGYVLGMDENSREKFLQMVPMPPRSGKQEEWLDAIRSDDDAVVRPAAKKINAEARNTNRNWKHFLSHPDVITVFLEAIGKAKNADVYEELIWALVFICERHLRDLRALPYFLEATRHKRANIRWLGLMGLRGMTQIPIEEVAHLEHDKSLKVREQLAVLQRIVAGRIEFPVKDEEWLW